VAFVQLPLRDLATQDVATCEWGWVARYRLLNWRWFIAARVKINTRIGHYWSVDGGLLPETREGRGGT
jgi:hypothetical protein